MKTAWWIEWPYAAWITVALVLLTVLSLSLHAHAEEPGPQESHPQSDGPPGLFIKIAPPARQLIAAEVSGLPADRTLTLTSLQGIVNQTEPRIFLVEGGFARLWLDWLVTRGDIDGVRYVPAAQPEALIEEFKDELRGQVVVDPRVPATLNLATMIAALDRLLITYPDYAEHYAERYGLPIVTDLRGLFNRNGEAYRWALDNLWARLNHHALALLHPDVPHPRDFIIQQKIWVWWQGGTADSGGLANRLAELTVTYDVLKAAPVNIPVLGYPWKGEGVGLGEHGGVDLLSRYGKFLVPSDLARNLSVHANTRPPARAALQNEAPDSPSPSEPDPDKVYLTVIVSDGDNVQALLNYFPRYFEEPEGRTAPVAWTISPAAWDLIPDVVDYYAARRLPGDAFIAAVSGIGYVYLDRYGADLPNKDEAVRGFLQLTSDYMDRMGLTMLWPMVPEGPVPQSVLALYAAEIENLQALFPDYGQKVPTYAQATYTLEARGRTVPVFHAMGGETPLARSIQTALADAPRPAFVHVFALNWNVSPGDLAALDAQLGDGYVIVSPEQLVALFRR